MQPIDELIAVGEACIACGWRMDAPLWCTTSYSITPEKLLDLKKFKKQCTCTFSQHFLGDGCEVCNPQRSLEIIRENHKETKEALNAVLHYIDKSGVFPEGWDWERIREVAE